MLVVEDVLSELAGEEGNERGLPPGFRFHPTDEELITFYLASKVFNGGFFSLEIPEVDLNRCEPWDLPEIAKMGEREWYLFSLRDRKYPTGLRTNRATTAGYWKATGKDKEVYGGGALLGMKKTLVFYKGRAPRGVKTRWVMHEYRLEGDLSLRHTRKEEWVICRVYHKTGEKKSFGIQQGQNCHFHIHQQTEPSSSLPPLLETPQTQNPVAADHHHENGLKKTLINSVVSQLNISNYSAPKHCKTESGYFSTVDADSNLNWVGKIQQNPPFQGADYGLLGGPTNATAEYDVMSVALDKSSFHMMLDSPSGFPAVESWPFNI